MAKRRLGTSPSVSISTQPDDPRPVLSDTQPALVLTHRGPGDTLFTEFDFDEFKDEPLIWDNRGQLFERQIINRSQETLDALKLDLRKVKLFLSSLRENEKSRLLKINDLTVTQLALYNVFAGVAADPHRDVRSYRRIMKALGVDPSRLAPNPYPRRKSQPKPTVNPNVARSVMNEAKRQADVVSRRVNTLASILAGDTHLATLIRQVAEPSFIVNFMRANKWERKKIGYRLGNAEGPQHVEITTEEAPETSKRIVTWSVQKSSGHVGLLRWVYPTGIDLLPYFAMMLIRAPINLTPLGEAKADAEPFAPFPLNVTSKPDQEFFYFFASKLRGRKDGLAEPYVQPSITPKIGYSYPYQIFAFVKKLTDPVRSAITEQIRCLRAENHTVENSKELRQLEAIKNDLFVYRSPIAFRSYRTIVNESSGLLTRGFEALGLAEPRRILRTLQLRFGYEHSGDNIVEAQIQANHRDPRTTARYTRHEKNIKKKLLIFEDVFGHSMVLIEAGTFNAETLRMLLESQGLNSEQIGNLMSDENETSWGNRCSSPRNPPKGFDAGTQPGEICRLQNCIDGCPNARWFADARPRVKMARDRLVLRLASVPTSGTNGSSLETRIELCDQVLAALDSVGR